MKESISIPKLRGMLSEMLSYLEELGFDNVKIEWDKYWDIKQPAIRYGGAPPDTDAPDEKWLSADWMAVKDIADPKKHMEKMVELSDLLRAIGDYLPHLLQVQEVWNMSEEDLYKHLGMASLGTESVSEAFGSMEMLMSTARNTDAKLASESLGDSLLKRGQRVFVSLWDGLKEVVCTIYKDKTGIGDAKDLVAYLVAAVVAAGTISNPLAVLVITIAFKKGLEKLCTT
jgi:hypothetical protein